MAFHRSLDRFKKLESGRSMVEMLAVLAIMGLLSVIGAAGYLTAVNHFRANELIDKASKRAVVVSTQLMSGEQPTLDQFKTSGTQWSVDTSNLNNQFKIVFPQPSSAVCEHVNAIVGPTSMIREIGADCSYFLFNDDLSTGDTTDTGNSEGSDPDNPDPDTPPQTPKQLGEDCMDNTECDSGLCYQNECTSCSGDENCGDCQICNEGKCQSQCAGDVQCLADIDTGNKICCSSDIGQPLDGFCCKSIGGTQENPTCCRNADGTACCGSDQPLASPNNACYSCDQESIVTGLGKVSYRCESVCAGKRLWYNAYGYCIRCPQPGGNRVMDYFGDLSEARCAKCSDTMEWDAQAGKCIFHPTCNDTDMPLESLDGKTCHSCDEGTITDLGAAGYRCESVCAGKRIWHTSYGYCVRCPQPGGSRSMDYFGDLSEARCAKCSDTMEWDAQAKKCIFHPTCKNDKPLESLDGQCHSCDEDTITDLGAAGYRCESVCAGKRLWYNAYGYCLRCPQPGGDRSAPYLGDLSQANCAKCSDTMEWDAQAGKCIFHKTCTGDTPLESLDGKTCHSCDEGTITDLGAAGYRCESVCAGKRIWHTSNALCVRCPQPGGSRSMDYFGDLSEARCAKCSDTMEWDAQAQKCIFHPTCSQNNAPLESLDGSRCHSCDEGTIISDLGNAGYRCESVCAGKRLWYNAYGYCIRCPQPGGSRTMDYFGDLSEAKCAKCGDTMEWDAQAGKCIFHPTCNGDTPLESLDGKTCYSCNDASIITSLGAAGYRCESVCSGKRIWYNPYGYCIRCPQPGESKSMSYIGTLNQTNCAKCSDTMYWDQTNNRCEFKPQQS